MSGATSGYTDFRDEVIAEIGHATHLRYVKLPSGRMLYMVGSVEFDKAEIADIKLVTSAINAALAEANAGLIAAASAMLTALKASRRYVESLEQLLDPRVDEGAATIREHAAMVRAAIAKAEGR